MKKLFIIGSDFKWEEEQLLKEGKLLGFNSNFLLLEKISFHLGKTTKILYQGENILDKINSNTTFLIRRSRGEFEKLLSLVNYFDKNGIKYTDTFGSISTNLNKKLSLTSIESNLVPHPPFTTFLDKNNFKNLTKEKISFPCISKPVNGRHGEGVVILKNYEEFKKYLLNCKETQIVQGFIKIKAEYRIFIIKGECFGVIQKIPEEGNFIANYAAGAEFKIANLPESIINEAIKICEIQGIEIAGYDVAENKEGNFFTLEVNRCPEFKAFSKAQSINIAKEILIKI